MVVCRGRQLTNSSPMLKLRMRLLYSQAFSSSWRTLNWRLLQTLRPGRNVVHQCNLYAGWSHGVMWTVLSVCTSGSSHIQPWAFAFKAYLGNQNLEEWQSRTFPRPGPSAPILPQGNSRASSRPIHTSFGKCTLRRKRLEMCPLSFHLTRTQKLNLK